MAGKEVAAKLMKQLDWEALSKAVVSDEGRRELGNLRRAFDEFSSVLRTKFSVKPQPIDWDFYSKKLDPEIVGSFKKAHDELTVPAYEDLDTPEFRKKFDALMEKVAKQEEVSKKHIELCNQKLKEIREEKEALKTMTADEYFVKHPEVKKEIDEEIKNHNWGY